METKADIEYKTSNIFDKLEEKKEEFLMKFEKKILDDLLKSIEDNFSSIFEEQKNNAYLIQKWFVNNNIIDEKTVKFTSDVIRNIYKFNLKNSETTSNSNESMFLTKNSCSVWIWSVELKKWIVKVQFGDITQRDKQSFVIDTWTILSYDILIISIRNKKDSKILIYKIPTVEELKDLGTDYLVYSEQEWIGSFDIVGRVCLIKDSLLNSEVFYMIAELNDKFNLLVMKLQEKVIEDEELQMIASLHKLFEKPLISDIMDLWEITSGIFSNHLVILYGRKYEIYLISQDEYKEANFLKFTKIEGHYGILLPPEFMEYYHKVKTVDEDYLIFIGSSKLEIRTVIYLIYLL